MRSLPKAVAAEQRLRSINSDVRVEAIVADLVHGKCPRTPWRLRLSSIDGTDNFETRLLLNDAAISLNTPWIYAAAVGSYGVTLTIRPGQTACLACLLEGREKPFSLGTEDTCDTAGILNAAAGVIASIEAAEAIKLLIGKPETSHGRLVSCDVWTGKFQSIRISRNPDCRACSRKDFTHLNGDAQPHVSMCGSDSVQIHQGNRSLDLGALGRRLMNASATDVRNNNFLLPFSRPTPTK